MLSICSHSNIPAFMTYNNEDCTSTDSIYIPFDDFSIHNGIILPPSFPRNSTDNFSNEYQHYGRGISSIIHQSFGSFNQPILPESKFNFQLAKFLNGLTHSQRIQFIDILNESHRPNILNNTGLPRTMNEIRTQYLEGKTSILNSLPTPPFHVLPGHAYVSLELVQYPNLCSG